MKRSTAKDSSVAGAPPAPGNELGGALDAADRRILRALQADGRLSNKELARRANLSESACWARTRRL